MSKQILPDDVWARVEPLLPTRSEQWKTGRPPLPDRDALRGILFVLKTGIPWEDFPQEMGCCGMTLWNRLHEWMKAGVWGKLHRLLLDELRGADEIDFDRVIVDSASVRAVHGGKKRDRAPWTAANAAPSTTWSSMRAAFRWPARSPRPIATT